MGGCDALARSGSRGTRADQGVRQGVRPTKLCVTPNWFTNVISYD